ncbi:MAG: thiamine pyrophosphate-dependent dehydrogenase E1 component subunit alpha [Chloroflexi bacterium]|nr:thiamine pyrophosphate-dependent dehydrogenase E1 component subunit alpha [Chloroflexota bacterium]
MPVTDAQLVVRIYRLALTARAVDERLWILGRQGRVNFVLTARGHEVAQITTALTLRPGLDSAWFYYRDLAAALALGVTPYEIFLGALGRASDPHSGGRQLTAHFSSPQLGIGSVSSVVAGGVPHAVGAAYAARVLGQDSVAMTYFGDGAASSGQTHEAMNFAAVHRLPVVFVCENNGYALSVPLEQQMAVASLADRAAAYGMPGCSVDGTDALAVHGAACDAVQRARNGGGPTLIEARVPRMLPHSSQDDDAYRSPEERAAVVAADPLPRLRGVLLDCGALSSGDADAEFQRIRAEVLADEDRAVAEPEPQPGRARRWLYADQAQ